MLNEKQEKMLDKMVDKFGSLTSEEANRFAVKVNKAFDKTVEMKLKWGRVK
jgi:polyhydroxyalkanoate synthesis regulator phasin